MVYYSTIYILCDGGEQEGGEGCGYEVDLGCV